MKLKRVVITGLGALTPIGNNISEYWENLLAGVSGSDLITHFDAEIFKTKFACEVKNFNVADHLDRKEMRKMDLFTQYALIATKEAIEDAQITNSESIDKNRVGVIIGSGIGGFNTFLEEVSNFVKGGEIPRFNPFFIPKVIGDIASGYISIQYGFRGPNYATTSACASAGNAMADAFNLIRLGKSDIIVTGGAESVVATGSIGGFNAMHALSTRNDDYKTASRPFDKDRDGFVLGEGSGILIFEELEHAKARGAKIYAEILGTGLSADAHHITSPHPEGEGAYLAMKEALEEAGLKPEQISHINTHGTSTPQGDVAELKAIQKLFGEHAYRIAINSTKSMTGHLLGAAAAIEAIAAIFAIREGKVPPTINIFELDPEIDPKLDIVKNQYAERKIQYAMSNSFGFGGHNTSVVFGAYNE